MLKQIITLLLFLHITCLTVAYSGVPSIISFTGRLTGADYTPRTGNFSLTFKIYNTETGGIASWTETQPVVSVTNGVFTVMLGTVTVLPTSVFESPDCWVEVTVGSSVLSPRIRLVSSPFVHIAGRAYGVIGTTITTANIVNNTIIRDDISNDIGNSSLITNLNADMFDGMHQSSFISTNSVILNNLTVTSSMNITGTGVTGTNPVFQVMNTTFNVTGNGNIGIGTTSPAQKLSVVGNIDVTGTVDGIDISAQKKVYYTGATDSSGNATVTPANLGLTTITGFVAFCRNTGILCVVQGQLSGGNITIKSWHSDNSAGAAAYGILAFGQ
jgi:hypothetical protein